MLAVAAWLLSCCWMQPVLAGVVEDVPGSSATVFGDVHDPVPSGRYQLRPKFEMDPYVCLIHSKLYLYDSEIARFVKRVQHPVRVARPGAVLDPESASLSPTASVSRVCQPETAMLSDEGRLDDPDRESGSTEAIVADNTGPRSLVQEVNVHLAGDVAVDVPLDAGEESFRASTLQGDTSNVNRTGDRPTFTTPSKQPCSVLGASTSHAAHEGVPDENCASLQKVTESVADDHHVVLVAPSETSIGLPNSAISECPTLDLVQEGIVPDSDPVTAGSSDRTASADSDDGRDRGAVSGGVRTPPILHRLKLLAGDVQAMIDTELLAADVDAALTEAERLAQGQKPFDGRARAQVVLAKVVPSCLHSGLDLPLHLLESVDDPFRNGTDDARRQELLAAALSEIAVLEAAARAVVQARAAHFRSASRSRPKLVRTALDLVLLRAKGAVDAAIGARINTVRARFLEWEHGRRCPPTPARPSQLVPDTSSDTGLGPLLPESDNIAIASPVDRSTCDANAAVIVMPSESTKPSRRKRRQRRLLSGQSSDSSMTVSTATLVTAGAVQKDGEPSASKGTNPNMEPASAESTAAVDQKDEGIEPGTDRDVVMGKLVDWVKRTLPGAHWSADKTLTLTDPSDRSAVTDLSVMDAIVEDGQRRATSYWHWQEAWLGAMLVLCCPLALSPAAGRGHDKQAIVDMLRDAVVAVRQSFVEHVVLDCLRQYDASKGEAAPTASPPTPSSIADSNVVERLWQRSWPALREAFGGLYDRTPAAAMPLWSLAIPTAVPPIRGLDVVSEAEDLAMNEQRPVLYDMAALSDVHKAFIGQIESLLASYESLALLAPPASLLTQNDNVKQALEQLQLCDAASGSTDAHLDALVEAQVKAVCAQVRVDIDNQLVFIESRIIAGLDHLTAESPAASVTGAAQLLASLAQVVARFDAFVDDLVANRSRRLMSCDYQQALIELVRKAAERCPRRPASLRKLPKTLRRTMSRHMPPRSEFVGADVLRHRLLFAVSRLLRSDLPILVLVANGAARFLHEP